MAGFKSYFGFWLFQGTLLEYDRQVLINAQEGQTKAQRQRRMNTAKEFKPAIVKSDVKEAITLVMEGRQVAADRKNPTVVPSELKKALRANKAVSESFKKSRLGLQREYAKCVADLKREEPGSAESGIFCP